MPMLGYNSLAAINFLNAIGVRQFTWFQEIEDEISQYPLPHQGLPHWVSINFTAYFRIWFIMLCLPSASCLYCIFNVKRFWFNILCWQLMICTYNAAVVYCAWQVQGAEVVLLCKIGQCVEIGVQTYLVSLGPMSHTAVLFWPKCSSTAGCVILALWPMHEAIAHILDKYKELSRIGMQC